MFISFHYAVKVGGKFAAVQRALNLLFLQQHPQSQHFSFIHTSGCRELVFIGRVLPLLSGVGSAKDSLFSYSGIRAATSGAIEYSETGVLPSNPVKDGVKDFLFANGWQLSLLTGLGILMCSVVI
mmetsp:Transcript_4647/g.6075  ORF Transcript_4647/g.6075 Transcript_4647/m.6075 type:complete len:125 (-) Transcript_4647:2715-3089(-)